MRELAPAPLSLYAGRAGFIAPEAAARHVEDVASANWFASASLAATVHGSALFIDMGSTTTDIVPVASGAVAACGYTDAERLAAGELVYTGLVRSFVMAVAARAPLAGRWTPLINENFANMADVHRILGTLPDGADQMTTADGREKTVQASVARLARMVGCDAGDAEPGQWAALAHWFAEAQLRSVVDAAMLVLSSCRAAGRGADRRRRHRRSGRPRGRAASRPRLRLVCKPARRRAAGARARLPLRARGRPCRAGACSAARKDVVG